jgi:hypothetical protein
MEDMGMTDTQFKGFISFLLDDIQEVQEKLEKETLTDEKVKEKVKKIADKLEQIMKD